MGFIQELWKYRKQIDKIDLEILKLFAKRFEIVLEIWKLKRENNIQSLDKKRWNEVLWRIIEEWKKMWLSEEFVVDVWERVHEESLRVEKHF
jgi:chorismate mutase